MARRRTDAVSGAQGGAGDAAATEVKAHPEADDEQPAPVDPKAPIQPGGPPVGYIQAQRVALEQRDRPRNDLITQLESIRFHTSDTDPHIPEGFEKSTVKVRNPLLGDMVDRVTSALTMDPWRVRLDNDLASANAAREDGELERASNRLLDTMDRVANRNVRRLMTDQLVGTGRTTVKVAHKADWWKRYPTSERVFAGKKPEDLSTDENAALVGKQETYKRRNPMPFYWEDLDVRTYHEVGGGNGGPAEAVVVSQVAKLPLMQRYDLVMMKDGRLRRRELAMQDTANVVWDVRNPYSAAYLQERLPASVATTSEWVEHWTADEPDEDTGEVAGGWFSYIVDGELVRQRRHEYMRLPFFQILGLSTSSRDPKYEALSVIFHIAGMSLLLDSFLTIGSNAAYFEGFGTYQEVINPQLMALFGQQGINFNPLQGRKTLIEPGKLMHPTLGEIKAVMGTGLSQAVDRMVQQTELMISQAGISAVLKGSLGGDPSGWLASQLLTASMIGFFPITDGLAKGGAAIIDHLYRMTERIVGEDIPLGDARIRVRDVADYGAYNIAVDIKPRLPSNDIARGTFGDQGVASGTISMKRNREDYWGIEDPVAEQDQIDVENAMKDPLVLEAKKKIALYDPAYGIVQMLEKAATVEQAFAANLQQIQNPQPAAGPEQPEPGGGGPTGALPFTPGLNGAPLQPPEPEPGAGGGPAPSQATGLAAQGGGQQFTPPNRVTELPNG